MKIVEVYETRDDGTDRVIMTVKLVGKSCRFDGAKFLAKELKDRGIYTNVGKWGKYLFPHDGLKFMKQLSTHYTGSRIRASDVLIVPD
jgi:hypothetical protein